MFRARLTPKPYRIGIKPPESRFPRETPESRDGFSGWLSNYDQRSNNYAVCKFIGTAGKNSIHSALADLVKEHDRATRSETDLPLA